MSTFDFVHYLISQIPSTDPSHIAIHRFSGGFVNSTVRASFDPPATFQGQQFSSVILKHAAVTMSIDASKTPPARRQANEAHTLNILTGKNTLHLPEVSTVTAAYPEVLFPKVIHHDETEHVLWLSDFGKTQTFSEFLLSEPAPDAGDVGRISKQVAGFISKMMSATTPFATVKNAFLTGPSESALFVEEWLANHSGKVMEEYRVPDAAELRLRMLKSARGKCKEPCAGMIDLWPGNILITSNHQCAFVDWEFFDVTTASGPLAAFVCPLHVALFNSAVPTHSKGPIRAFLTHLLRAWKSNNHSQPTLYFKHKFLLSYGGTIFEAVEYSPTRLSKEDKSELVEVGAMMLRAAGEDEGDVDLGRVRKLGEVWEELWKDVKEMFQ